VSKASELLGDFAHAVDRLAEACERVAADATGDALLRDGLIQRFEFCFELGWKARARTIKLALLGAGYSGTDFIEGFMKKAVPA